MVGLFLLWVFFVIYRCRKGVDSGDIKSMVSNFSFVALSIWGYSGVDFLSTLAILIIHGVPLKPSSKLGAPRKISSVSSNFTITHQSVPTEDSNFTQFISYKPQNYLKSVFIELGSAAQNSIKSRWSEDEAVDDFDGV